MRGRGREMLGRAADGSHKPLYYFQLVGACVSCMPVFCLQEEVSRLILFSHPRPGC